MYVSKNHGTFFWDTFWENWFDLNYLSEVWQRSMTLKFNRLQIIQASGMVTPTHKVLRVHKLNIISRMSHIEWSDYMFNFSAFLLPSWRSITLKHNNIWWETEFWTTPLVIAATVTLACPTKIDRGKPLLDTDSIWFVYCWHESASLLASLSSKCSTHCLILTATRALVRRLGSMYVNVKPPLQDHLWFLQLSFKFWLSTYVWFNV